MGLLQNIRDKFIIKPVAEKILATLTQKADMPSAFAVPPGFNNTMATSNKRQTSSAVDFAMLKTLSINHETTRAAINARKRQITQLEFDVVDVDDDDDPQGTAAERENVKKMLANIGGPGVRFRALLDKLIEDLLVYDAMVFYKQRTRGGRLLRIIPIDGATIKLRVDQNGLRPLAPEVAFEQWVRGELVAEMTTDEMSYEMLNPRNDSPYGLSPLESLTLSIDAEMRALLYNLNYLSDNNVPQGFLQVPEGWNVNQIKEYKEYLDAMIAGSKATSKIYPIPSGTTYQATSKPTDYSFADFFDYLDRKVCMMFDIQPQELGLNLKQYKENAEGQEKIQIRKGVKPLANFLQEIFTELIQNEFGFTQYKFKFVGLDGKYTLEDVKALVPLGVMSIDEARNDRGLSKLGVANMIITQGGTIIPVTPDMTENIQDQQRQEQESLNKPKEKMEKLEKSGKNEGFEALEKTAKFSDFRKDIKKALKKQILPFTDEAMIAKVTETKKDDLENTIGENIDEEMPSLDIYFDSSSINQFLKWVAQQGSDNASKQIGITQSFKLTSTDFKRMLGDRSNYLIDSVNETTKNWIVGKIIAGKESSLTNAEIAQRIADNIDGISSARADMIVNTEVANALGAAQVDIYKRQGIEEKEWVTSEDEKVCPICNEMDGETVKVDDQFSDGIDHEPAHPDCRCYTIAVLDQVN